ncbi:hypothetical protein [Paenibacillus sp. FSL M7-0896]|uniref:hypothetical protein n=1 Tax=Paenibacillus sp. FSL M7-0896 TaxID=2921610 RepID=UPI0030DDB2D4
MREPNVVEKPTTMRRMKVREPNANVIEKPTTMRRMRVREPNVIEKPTTFGVAWERGPDGAQVNVHIA